MIMHLVSWLKTMFRGALHFILNFPAASSIVDDRYVRFFIAYFRAPLWLVLLDVATDFARVVLKLAFGCIERIAQGHIDIFGMIAVNHDLAARHANIEAHIEMLALLMVLVRHLDHYPAGHDAVEKFIELVRLVTDVRFQRL